jgi:hypothetical protein
MTAFDIVYLSVCGLFMGPLVIALLWRWLVMCWEVFRD